jgi:hypothetical protein
MKKLMVFILLLSTTIVMGQGAEPAMADGFRADGKIYVVIAVLATILIGIAVFLFYLDAKLNSIKKMIENNNQSNLKKNTN